MADLESNAPDAAITDTGANGRVSFEQAAAAALGDLQRSIGLLFETVPGGVRKAADVDKAFGLDRKLGWQLYRVATARNPLAAAEHVPARSSMERLLKAAARRRVPEQLKGQIAEAFAKFQSTVERHADDRAEFDAIIAAALPESQEKMWLAGREAMYHAARSIRGAAVQTSLFCHILHSTKGSEGRLDAVKLVGQFGLRRIRRSAHVELHASRHLSAQENYTTIDGRPVASTTELLLPEFCSQPLPRVRLAQHEGESRYLLVDEGVGIEAAIDVVFADVKPSWRERYATRERPVAGAGAAPDVPARWQVVDVILQEGVAPIQEPLVQVHDLVPRGLLTHFPDASREIDLVPFEPRARYMGRGLESFRCLHVPRYEEMLARVCERMGWHASELHGYRVELEYPAYSWQTSLALKLPPRGDSRG